MNLAALTLAALAVLAAPDDAPPKPVSVRMVAVQALKTGHKTSQYDKGCHEVRGALADLKQFDTYRLVKAGTATAPFGKETRLPINAKYALYITPLSATPEGAVKLKARIAMAPKKRSEQAANVQPTNLKPTDGKPTNVVTTTVSAAPDKKFKLGGPNLEEGGTLVVVLCVKGTTPTR